MDKKLNLFILWLLSQTLLYAQVSENQSGYSPVAKLPSFITVDIENLNPKTNQNVFALDNIVESDGTTVTVIPVTQFIASLPNDGYSGLVYPPLENIISAAQATNPVIDVIVTMPFETYIQGVDLAELTSPPEAAKAQAVVARTYVSGFIMASYNEWYTDSNGVSYAYNTIGTSKDQAFQVPVTSNLNYLPQDISAALTAVSATSGKAIKCLNRNIGADEFIFAKFGGDFGGTSLDEIFKGVNDNDWDWPPYLKSRSDYTLLINVQPQNQLGFCQLGAADYASYPFNWDYQGILNYYYAVTPPIVRAVDIYQGAYDDAGDNLRWSYQWDDCGSIRRVHCDY